MYICTSDTAAITSSSFPREKLLMPHVCLLCQICIIFVTDSRSNCALLQSEHVTKNISNGNIIPHFYKTRRMSHLNEFALIFGFGSISIHHIFPHVLLTSVTNAACILYICLIILDLLRSEGKKHKLFPPAILFCPVML